MLKKAVKSGDSRAYINPVPSMSELEQRILIEKFGFISEWYTESRSVNRDDFFRQLRSQTCAVVACTANLAVTVGNKMLRVADLMDARGEIHARGAVLVEAATGLRSDRDWPKMKAVAIPMLGRMAQGRKSSLNGIRGHPPLKVTNVERKTIRYIMENRNYKNWPERKAAIIAEGIEVPSLTWIYNRILYVYSETK